MNAVYRFTFIIGVPPVGFTGDEDSTPLCSEPVRIDCEHWAKSLEPCEVREALRAGLAAYVRNEG